MRKDINVLFFHLFRSMKRFNKILFILFMVLIISTKTRTITFAEASSNSFLTALSLLYTPDFLSFFPPFANYFSVFTAPALLAQRVSTTVQNPVPFNNAHYTETPFHGFQQVPPIKTAPSITTNKNDEQSYQNLGVSRAMRTPIYGSIHQTAYYFVDALVGSKDLQRQSLIADTGSSVMAFACDTCKACGVHMDVPYQCSLSSTCKHIPCSDDCSRCLYGHFCSHCVESCPICSMDQTSCAYDVQYAEGSSISGTWYVDFVQFPLYGDPAETKNSISAPQLVPFGCHQEETNLFLDQMASGILGLQLDASYGPSTFLHSKLNSKMPHEKLFSLCLAEEGGLFSLYEPATNLHIPTYRTDANGQIMWLSQYNYHKMYAVELISITIGQNQIPVSIYNSFFYTLSGRKRLSSLDSGTTLTYFPTDVKNSITQGIEDHLNQLSILGSKSQSMRSPRFLVSSNSTVDLSVFGNDIKVVQSGKVHGVSVELPDPAHPRRAQTVYPEEGKSKCWYLPRGDEDLALFPVLFLKFKLDSSSDAGSGDLQPWHPSSYLYKRGSSNYRCLSIESSSNVILGMTFFINKEIIFDLHNKRIGISEAQCPEFKIKDRYL